MRDGVERLLVFVLERLSKVGHISASAMCSEKCGLILLIIRTLPLMMIAMVRCFLFGHWKIAKI